MEVWVSKGNWWRKRSRLLKLERRRRWPRCLEEEEEERCCGRRSDWREICRLLKRVVVAEEAEERWVIDRTG